MSWKIHPSYNWQELELSFDWIRDMKGVQQSPIYHGEGDVFVHTQLVLKELFDLSAFQQLDEQAQHILAAAVLLHDVEKRSTTVHEPDGRITSAGHAKKGEFTARNILYREVKTPFAIRETIAKLVRYHGAPLWIFERKNAQQYLHQISLEVNTQWLAILAEADARGRICPDKEELIYRIDLFRELCHEQNCWEKPKVFASDVTRFKYFQQSNISPDYALFDETRFNVFLLSGIPGAGKDTYLQKHLKDYPVVSLDQIRREHKIAPDDKKGNGKVIQLAKEQAKVFMRQQQSFVWNATNTTQQMREQLIDLFTTYGAHVTIVYIETPYQQLIQQNKSREHVVPLPVLHKLIQKLEVPSLTEAHQVIYEV